MTKSSKKLIFDRSKIEQFVVDNFSPLTQLLHELVDYGIDLLDKCGQYGGSLSDLVVTGHFFGHLVNVLDAVEIQLSKGAVLSAAISARSMLETYIYIKWILESDTERRGRQFYVWYLRQRRAFARQFIRGTSEYEYYMKQHSILPKLNDSEMEKEARKEDADITAILTNKNNNLINQYFDKLKKKKHDVAWYKPFGPNSINDMIKQLQLESEYYYFYSYFSNIAHAGSFEKRIKFDGKAVLFEPIRNPEGMRTLVSVVVPLVLWTFILIIEKYLPKELNIFTQRYMKHWRKPFLSVPNIVVKNEIKKVNKGSK
ncbi:MAG: hypothetical protein IMZ63_02765 [Actinobacteria bacterium]|nr:hypothetical protein [Actinomycetota bacterium]